jgi:hypothetical protein
MIIVSSGMMTILLKVVGKRSILTDKVPDAGGGGVR